MVKLVMEDFKIWLIIILILWNLVAFILVGFDKQRSIAQERRVPEVYLFFVAVLFASLGVFAGMYSFRHKTRKSYFPIGIGILLVQQIALVALFLNKVMGSV